MRTCVSVVKRRKKAVPHFLHQPSPPLVGNPRTTHSLTSVIMSSGRLETKKSGDFYWSKDEVSTARMPRSFVSFPRPHCCRPRRDGRRRPPPPLARRSHVALGRSRGLENGPRAAPAREKDSAGPHPDGHRTGVTTRAHPVTCGACAEPRPPILFSRRRDRNPTPRAAVRFSPSTRKSRTCMAPTGPPALRFSLWWVRSLAWRITSATTRQCGRC